MAQQNILRFVYAFILSVVIIKLALCTRETSYTEYAMENEKICHGYGKKGSLRIIKNLAILVKANYMLERWFVIDDKRCKFSIEANQGDGLFGVIQKMSFRRNGTRCLDYVQFKRSDHQRTEKFCGHIDRSKTRYYPVPEPENTSYEFGPVSSNSYAEYDINENRGQLETEIFISKTKLLPGEYLELSIVYTPYKACDKVAMDEFKSIGHNTCIWKSYFCDGYQNCAPGVCLDEAGCENPNSDVVSSGTGTKVTVGAVTTILLIFIIFSMCIWICKRHKQLCWSSDCAGPSACPRPATLQHDTEGPASPPVPTAPMLEVVVTPAVLDKDLPPSYDSLFPEQRNPATS